MHWEILDETRIQILKQLTDSIQLSDYYMAGGTALSLQMGLRKSVDFDFFVPHSFDTEGLFRQIRNIFHDETVSVIEVNSDTCNMDVSGVRVSFFKYTCGMLQPVVRTGDMENLRLASPEDIAVMKASAIGGRGAKKDFFDLYFILNRRKISPEDLAKGLYRKYGKDHDFFYIGMGLGYFTDAEKEDLPETFVQYNWNQIKEYFISIQPKFERELERVATEELSLEI